MERTLEPELMDDPREAEVYARADFAEVNARFVADLLAFAGDPGVLRALDLGCGPADISVRVAQCRPRWSITGLDASLAMLRLASAQRPPFLDRLMLVMGSAHRLPFGDASVDLIFSNSLLHHLPDPSLFWRECGRIARGGGRLFLRDLRRPHSSDEAGRLVREYAGGEPELLQQEFHRSLLAAFTVEEVETQLSGAGLAQLRVRPVGDRHLDVLGEL